MYYVYVLANQDGWHYTGSCEDLEARLKRHNQNSVRSTKHKGPLKVIYKEEFKTRTEERKRENEIKRRKDKGYLIGLIERQSPSSSLV